MATLVRRYFATLRPAPRPPPTSALPGPPRARSLPAVTAAKSGVRETKENRANYPKYEKAKREKVFEIPNKNMLPVYIYIYYILYIYIYTYIKSPQRLPQCAQAEAGSGSTLYIRSPIFFCFLLYFFQVLRTTKKPKKKKPKKKPKKIKGKQKRRKPANVTCKIAMLVQRSIDI